MKKPRLLFIATEDWFFRSHFLSLARRAAEEGFDVALAARMSGALSEGDGLRLIDTRARRGGRGVVALVREAMVLRALIAREAPDVVHAIALKSVILSLLAGARDCGRVFALTGRGHLAVSRSPWSRLTSVLARRAMRDALDAPRTVLMVENEADRDWVGGERSLPNRRVVLSPGAGVDPAAYPQAPMPEGGAIIVGVAARLIRSKGVDLAIEAVKRLREQGQDVVLRIAGARDQDNPDCVSAREEARWKAEPGVEALGRIEDIATFWAGVHIACLPSRGGEGLPRTLLEAAACGRPLVSTDVPGCADFVRAGVMGEIVPSGDVPALAAALAKLARDAALRARMGAAARGQVEAQYTLQHAANAAAKAWRLVRPAR